MANRPSRLSVARSALRLRARALPICIWFGYIASKIAIITTVTGVTTFWRGSRLLWVHTHAFFGVSVV